MKKITSLLLALILVITPALAMDDTDDIVDVSIFDEGEPVLSPAQLEIPVPSAILMEKETGEILYEKNADERMPPASVTKVMTILLIVEELESGRLSLDDKVTASANASSMGGSQIFLKEGEQMSVHEMLKSVVVASANDASVALAEHIAGSEEAFVSRMNARAAELGMTNTTFLNCTGLPINGKEHLTTARDIATMSRELIRHDMIKEYTTIWMDTVRNGEFGLANTNKMIFYYDGATGLKTGFTQEAMYCLSATAERDGVEYIAVVLHGETTDERFSSAKALLSYAFANYSLVDIYPADVMLPVKVELGEASYVQPVMEENPKLLVDKTQAGSLTKTVELIDSVKAPVEKGQQLGTLTVYDGDTLLTQVPLIAADGVEKLTVGQIFGRFLNIMFTGRLYK